MKKTRKTGEPINRREMVKRTAAGVGAAIAFSDSGEAASASTSFTGLAAEYDQYDALGLAALIAKKQIAPLELLNDVRQRIEA